MEQSIKTSKSEEKKEAVTVADFLKTTNGRKYGRVVEEAKKGKKK